MDFKAVEGAILDRLQLKAPDFQSRRFPNNPAQNRALLSAKGEYLLRYAGSSYGAAVANNMGVLQQTRVSQWAVVVRCRDLSPVRDNANVYDMLEAARVALVKWTVPNVPDATVMTVLKDGFDDEFEGIWEYSLLVGFSFPEVTA